MEHTADSPPRDLADVVAARRASGDTVVAVVPAQDEEATVGQVVAGLRALVAADLLEEVVVVDGRSADDTAARAGAAGARVLLQDEAPRGLAPGGGKGDAMWQGVAATTADIVLFVDADVRGFTPEFVVPLLGPLLVDPGIHLVKAAYDRPLDATDTTDTTEATGTATGGGRVTELVARPLLALLWPELAFVAQPLAGEYAARRSLLEAVPFVQGYGVELALLVDTVERLGPAAIAQVDLGVRRHGHQPLDALGRMATEILAVALDRAAAQGRSPADTARLRQPTRGPDGALGHREHPITVRQRPPLAG